MVTQWERRVQAELDQPLFRIMHWMTLLRAKEARKLTTICWLLMVRHGAWVVPICFQALASRQTSRQKYGTLARLGKDVLRTMVAFLADLPMHPILAGLYALQTQTRDYQCLPRWNPSGDTVTHLTVGIVPGTNGNALWTRRWHWQYPHLLHLEVVGFCPTRLPKIQHLQSLTLSEMPTVRGLSRARRSVPPVRTRRTLGLGLRLAWCAKNHPLLRRLHLRGLRDGPSVTDEVLVPGVFAPVYPSLEEVCLVMNAEARPHPRTHEWAHLRYGNRPRRVFVDLPSSLYDSVFWN